MTDTPRLLPHIVIRDANDMVVWNNAADDGGDYGDAMSWLQDHQTDHVKVTVTRRIEER